MFVCPVGSLLRVDMIKCLEKTEMKTLFSLEQNVDLKKFEKLTKNVKNKEIIFSSFEQPSVLNNLYSCFKHLLKYYPDEFFTIIDIDDVFEENFPNNIQNFIEVLKRRNVHLGRFLGPRLNGEIINPRKFGYYYSTVFHVSIFKTFPPVSFFNPVHADNFIVGFALSHTDDILWLPKYLGYVHLKPSSIEKTGTSSENSKSSSRMFSGISSERLERSEIERTRRQDEPKTEGTEKISEGTEKISERTGIEKYFETEQSKLPRSPSERLFRSDSSMITHRRLEDTLFMYCLEPFGFASECYSLPKFTISIATMPKRIMKLMKTVDGLLEINPIRQKVIKIVINCAEKYEPLMKFCKESGVEFRFVEKDEGSFNKSHLTESEKDGLVLTLDDDVIYDSNIIQKLFRSFILSDRRTVFAGQVRELRTDYYETCPKVTKTDFQCVSVIGGSGVLYPPGFFKHIFKTVQETERIETVQNDFKTDSERIETENSFPDSLQKDSKTDSERSLKDEFKQKELNIDRNIFKTCDDMFFSMMAYKNNFKIKPSKYPLRNKSLGLSDDSLYYRARLDNFKEYSEGLKLVQKTFRENFKSELD